MVASVRKRSRCPAVADGAKERWGTGRVAEDLLEARQASALVRRQATWTLGERPAARSAGCRPPADSAPQAAAAALRRRAAR